MEIKKVIEVFQTFECLEEDEELSKSISVAIEILTKISRIGKNVYWIHRRGADPSEWHIEHGRIKAITETGAIIEYQTQSKNFPGRFYSTDMFWLWELIFETHEEAKESIKNRKAEISYIPFNK